MKELVINEISKFKKDVGEVVKLIGTLMVEERKCFVAPSDDQDSDFIVVLSDDGLSDLLLDMVPCRLGGKFLYQDYVEVIGEIYTTSEGYEVKNIEQLKLIRGDVEFDLYEEERK